MNKFPFRISAVFWLAWLVLPGSVGAVELEDGLALPHLGAAGQAGYLDFSAAPDHKAFAIAPGGAWSWVSGKASTEAAEAEALTACRQGTQQPCHLYASDDQGVFDEAAWSASFDLHLSAAQVAAAPLGMRRGDRLPDLSLSTPDGRPVTLSDFRGKPVFLHFWGSWCPPCQSEFVDLQKLYDALKGDNTVAFILVQGREPIAKSKRWAAKHGFTLPLYDSGHQGRSDKAFPLSNGSQLDHRRLAPAYPSTYILDANGLVVFRQAGAGKHWEQYEKLIRHIAPAIK